MESHNSVCELVEAFRANVNDGCEQEQCPVVIIREPSHALESWHGIAANARLDARLTLEAQLDRAFEPYAD